MSTAVEQQTPVAVGKRKGTEGDSGNFALKENITCSHACNEINTGFPKGVLQKGICRVLSK